MPEDEEETSEERARRLREEIERLTSGKEPPVRPGAESPREFVHRRRRELEEAEEAETEPEEPGDGSTPADDDDHPQPDED